MPPLSFHRHFPCLALGALAALTCRAADTTETASPPSGAASWAAVAGMAPGILPGNGLAQHPFMYAGAWDYPKKVQTAFIVRDGKIVWSYEIDTNLVAPDGTKTLQEFSDATLLSNGNLVFARKTGAGEVTPDKKLIWNYDAPKGFEVHCIQPIGTDRVMMVQNGDPATLRIINIVSGQTEKEIVLQPGNPRYAHTQFRGVRMTAAGTFLVPHMDANKVVEYDADGKPIWSVAVYSPWLAVRLKNGNTLISSNGGFVREFNPKGESVWQFSQLDVTNIRIFVVQGIERLANGNTLITNWCPNGIKNPKDWPDSVQLLEVTPDKKIVWALRSWLEPNDLGPATMIQLLDEPGVPETPGDQLR